MTTWKSTAVVGARVRALRKRHDWTAERLAYECAKVGMPGLNRSVIANLESGRRRHVSVDELMVLAYVLDAAPLHLLIPTEHAEDDRYQLTPDGLNVSVRSARWWFTGARPIAQDARVYWSETPRSDWTPPAVSDDALPAQGRDMEYRETMALLDRARGHWTEHKADGDDQ